MYDAFPVRGPVDVHEIHRLLEQHVVPAGDVQQVGTIKEVVDQVLHGHAVLLIDGEESALALGVRGFAQRSVAEPEVESIIRGPREGFVENIRTNTSLLRRRIRTPQFKLESYRLGRFTRTDVVIAYIQGLASNDLVEEVR